MQSLVIRQTNKLVILVARHEHWHDELLCGHGQTGPTREEEVVYPLWAVGATRVRVADVAEGGEPGVGRSVRVAIGERVFHHAPEDAVRLGWVVRQREGVQVAAEQFDVGVGLPDVLGRL